MKLDRNKNTNGLGKYALLNLRRNTVEWGEPMSSQEFFVIKLKDKHAEAALLAYAESVQKEDPEFASEIKELASRAGENNPWCKSPD